MTVGLVQQGGGVSMAAIFQVTLKFTINTSSKYRLHFTSATLSITPSFGRTMVLNGNPISGAKFNTYTTTTAGVILFHQLYHGLLRNLLQYL
jgi:hypothetical protein